MIDKNSVLLNKVKNSFEEILKFSKFFEFEGYTYTKLQILNYKKNNIWIIEYMRLDFTLHPSDQVRKQISKEGNSLYLQFSKPIINLLDIIDVDKNGVYLNIDDYRIYFDNKFKSITHGGIIDKLKNQYHYQFKESKVKLNFFYIHELYSDYSLQQFKYQRENFYNHNTGLINTGEDIFNDLMEMRYGLFSYSFIIFVFPIYSFLLNHKVRKEKDNIIVEFEKKIPNKLQNSIEIYYQLNDKNKRNLNENIIISKPFSGKITISINWYGDEAFLPKGALLYTEKIIIEDDKKEKMKEIKRNKLNFIEVDFLQYKLPDYVGIKNLINLCAYNLELYRLMPSLIRNLFENLLRDIFSSCLIGEYTYLYYNKDQSRVRVFSRLIELFRLLKREFESSYAMVMHDKIYENLDNFRRDGNYNIHQIQNIIEPNYAEKNKEKFIRTLENLLRLYRKITASKKKIEKIDSSLLKKYEQRQSIKIPPIKLDKNQISEISELISKIRFEINNRFKGRLGDLSITISDKNFIQREIDQLTAKVIQLRLKNSAYQSLIYSLSNLDSEFNSEFPYRDLLLKRINSVAAYFKFAISDAYNNQKKGSKEGDTSVVYTLKFIIYLLSVSLIIISVILSLIIFRIL